MILARLLTVTKKVNNYALDATGGGLWISTTEFRVTCPADKRWFLVGGVVKRNVSSTLIGYIRDVSDNLLFKLCDESAAASTTSFPEADYQIGTMPIMDAGEDLTLIFGTAQDAGSRASCVVLEIDV